MTPSPKLQALLEAAGTTGAGYSERQLIAELLKQESATASGWWRQTTTFVRGEEVLAPTAVQAFARSLQYIDDTRPELPPFVTSHTKGPFANRASTSAPAAASSATVTADVLGTVISIGDSRYAYQPPQQPMSAVHAAYERAVATGAVKFRN